MSLVTEKPGLIRNALTGGCPRCGARTLFKGWVTFAPRCSACGLDFEQFNVGDGAAAFLIFIILSLVFAGIIWVEVTFSPPWWVQMAIWLPVTIVLTLVLLRIAKGALIAAEYRNDAGAHDAQKGTRIK
ncbi:MAG: DUF983 domain-containing protein [Alphaproteobacteria bacterium]|nr:DUF983 domain-containing protein [Alphaproteobacteria bacterium]